jgi:hypothetical protein
MVAWLALFDVAPAMLAAGGTDISPVFAGRLLPRSGFRTPPRVDAQRLPWVRSSDKTQTPIGVSSAAAATPSGLFIDVSPYVSVENDTMSAYFDVKRYHFWVSVDM